MTVDPHGARRDEAQSLIEYTLLLGFVALAVISLFVGTGGSVQGLWTTANSSLVAAAGTPASSTPAATPPVTGGAGGGGGEGGGDGHDGHGDGH